MSNGSRRRSRKRYKIRYDRLVAVILVFIVLIVVITSFTKSCSKKNKDTSSKNSVVDELSTPPPAVTDANGQNVTDPVGNVVTQPNNAVVSTEYTTQNMEYIKINSGDLVLVNSLHDYKFQDGDVVLTTLFDNRNDFYGVSDNIISLDSNVITQLNAMMSDFYTANMNDYLRVIGGFRSLEVQNDRFNSGTSNIKGGYTDYHTARSFDLGIFPEASGSNYYSPYDNYAWIDQNAANYGFILRYPEGKETLTGVEARTYTYRYVGVPHAVYMKQNNLCLEEYIEQIKTYTNTAPLRVTNGASQFDVYYVAANVNNITEVPIPSNKPCKISGNNIDGFIVTVTIA